MPRFAANLSMMFNEVDFLDRFDAAAKAGFTAVEYLFPYDFPAEMVAEQLRNAGLSQALFNLPPGDWAKGERGLAALPERRDEFRQSVAKAVDYGQIIGTPLLHMMAGIAPHDDPATIASYRDSVSFAADAAGVAGIGLVLEPINSRDMPGYFLNDFNRAADLMADLSHPNIKLQFDIYHRQIIHGDVLVALEQMMPIIGHVQIASVPKRHEPGTGELDDYRIFAALDALGYQGYVGCEYRPAGGTLEGLDWLDKV
ncbi:hydroxypyruvate isomerase [Pararhizobium capsulatum DSM 1112]|uniref:Hydroxypyruvate isomerase n=1 Tax=Pararhizobium capsulatum DSM 1112 TaxID=1121113 RepID=A0ABU0BY24_9HYPH|nr:2-oxo-tetronate isomerase [Pararhizobium capsulatum]MDQ0322614.1 hydroxypyruvate isomerase [Pararhizobium capsulatum DSM 1112]